MTVYWQEGKQLDGSCWRCKSSADGMTERCNTHLQSADSCAHLHLWQPEQRGRLMLQQSRGCGRYFEGCSYPCQSRLHCPGFNHMRSTQSSHLSLFSRDAHMHCALLIVSHVMVAQVSAHNTKSIACGLNTLRNRRSPKLLDSDIK